MIQDQHPPPHPISLFHKGPTIHSTTSSGKGLKDLLRGGGLTLQGSWGLLCPIQTIYHPRVGFLGRALPRKPLHGALEFKKTKAGHLIWSLALGIPTPSTHFLPEAGLCLGTLLTAP